MCATTLPLLGFRVASVLANVATEALALIDRVRPGGVLIRIPPDTLGIDLIHGIRRHGRLRDTPIVVIAAAADEDVHDAARAGGADLMFVAPTAPDTIAAAFDRLLSERSARNDREQR
ncbi:MAG TPA: hypothetical protein VFT47_21500 [Vicinamibacterales bacterium]|nr:hypothetical protein [Vicinamibacterales bacterium]